MMTMSQRLWRVAVTFCLKEGWLVRLSLSATVISLRGPIQKGITKVQQNRFEIIWQHLCQAVCQRLFMQSVYLLSVSYWVLSIISVWTGLWTEHCLYCQVYSPNTFSIIVTVSKLKPLSLHFLISVFVQQLIKSYLIIISSPMPPITCYA